MINNKKIYNLIIGFFYASIPLMPLFTMYGFYGIGTLVSILYILNVVKLKKEIHLNFFDLSYLLFIIWNIFSINWSFSGEKSVIKYMMIYFVFVYTSIKLSFLINKNEEKVVIHFSKWFVISTIISSILCIIYELADNGLNQRLGVTFFAEPYGTRMMYTYNLEISIFLLLNNIVNKKNTAFLNKTTSIIIFIFLFICINLSATRKIFIGIICYSLCFIVINNKNNVIKLVPKLIIFGIIIVIGYYLIMNITFFYDSIGKRIEEAINYINGDGIDASYRDRNAMIDYGWKYFKNKPIIGNGSNTFHKLFKNDYNQDLYSHNTFIELLCNVGIIGFLIYYSIYIYCILKKSNSKYNLLIKCTIISLMVLDYWTISYYRIHFMIFMELATELIIRNKTSKK